MSGGRRTKAPYTGIILLEICNLQSKTDIAEVKRRAASWPTTMVALMGASGRTVKILVRGTLTDNSLPTEEGQVERFHSMLYNECARVYGTLLGRTPKAKVPRPTDWFRWTFDPEPFIHLDAAPLRLDSQLLFSRTDETTSLNATQCVEASLDNQSYYRRRFAVALQTVHETLPELTRFSEGELNAAALEALRLDIPQEETVRQAVVSLQWRQFDYEFIRSTVESVYAENAGQQGRNRSHPMQELTHRLQSFMQQRYDLRYNELTNGVEWRLNHSASYIFQPLDVRVINTMIQEAHEAGIEVFDRDMKRYLGSTRIRSYNIATDYLKRVRGQWDGHTDYIGEMADRVPCDSPHWREWFHTWLLGMVAQWQGWDTTHGNAVMPLLIGQQGCGKSTFGQLLLPPELRSAGYRELVDFSSKKEAETILATSLLINLDEFNQIPEKIQQGFLKNLVQKSSVKGRRPYSSTIVDLPRYASFIATNNMADVLNDPTGSRRFLVADIRDGATVNNQSPFYWDQMYAQAQSELEARRHHYFTPSEVADIEAYNARYAHQRPEVLHFFDVFEPATVSSPDTQTMHLSELIRLIHQRTRYEYTPSATNYLGRWLTTESRHGRITKTMAKGYPTYLVRMHPK